MKLRPVEFNWNTENNDVAKSLGFIAQEVETVIPKLVNTDSSTGLKELNTIGMIPVLTRAIQEQQGQIGNIGMALDLQAEEISALQEATASLTLNSTGGIDIVATQSSEASQASLTSPISPTYSLIDSTGEAINTVGAYAGAVIADLRTGIINTTELIAQNITTDTLITQTSLISPTVQTDSLIAQDARLDSLDARQATISGTLTGNIITADQLTAQTSQFEKLLTQDATVSGTINVSADASDNVGVVGVQFKLDGSNLTNFSIT